MSARGIDASTPRQAGGDLALVVAVAAAACPVALVAWAGAAVALRFTILKRWHLALAAAVSALSLIVRQPQTIAALAGTEAVRVVQGTLAAGGPSWAVLGALAGLLVRLAVVTAPLGVPAGLAAAVLGHGQDQATAELDPKAQRRRLRAELRRRHQARTLATRTAPSRELERPEIAPLAVSISGDLPPSWRQGRYVILPGHAARLPRLIIGRPGAGKSTYLAREAYLAGLGRRQHVVIDGKGEASFAAAVVDAYTTGRPDATVHLFPAEPLSVWQGGPAAVVNRLVDIRPWSVESDWYRELYVMALRLALGAPGDPVTGMAELVARLDPAALTRAWAGHPVEAGLVKNLAGKLTDVQVRAGNLAAALGGMLDGEHALGEADLTVVSLPTMAQPSDSEAVLRVLMSDAQHWAAVRKDPARPALLTVDEFSAIPGGRQAAINLLERGRSAGVPAILAGQSYASLGPEDERDRLVSAAGTLVLFASATPDELARLAGTVQTSEAVLAYDQAGWTGRASVTSRARHRVDPNLVRQLAVGEAVIVAAGRAEHVQVVQAPGSRVSPASRPALRSPLQGRPALPRRHRGA